MGKHRGGEEGGGHGVRPDYRVAVFEWLDGFTWAPFKNSSSCGDSTSARPVPTDSSDRTMNVEELLDHLAKSGLPRSIAAPRNGDTGPTA
jgi:hypothetical protein